MWVRFLPDAALPGAALPSAGDTSDDVDDMPNTGEYPGGYSGDGWADHCQEGGVSFAGNWLEAGDSKRTSVSPPLPSSERPSAT